MPGFPSDLPWIWQVDRSIPSDTTIGSELVNEVLTKFREEGWGDHDLFGVHMALEEALTNAIKHGNRGDGSKLVQVEINLAENKAAMRVTDQGPGFNPDDVPDPTADENLDKDSGRGILLMRSFMTGVEFNNTGNSVSMWKDRTAEGA